jgi:hypothetical protein
MAVAQDAQRRIHPRRDPLSLEDARRLVTEFEALCIEGRLQSVIPDVMHGNKMAARDGQSSLGAIASWMPRKR